MSHRWKSRRKILPISLPLFFPNFSLRFPFYLFLANPGPRGFLPSFCNCGSQRDWKKKFPPALLSSRLYDWEERKPLEPGYPLLASRYIIFILLHCRLPECLYISKACWQYYSPFLVNYFECYTANTLFVRLVTSLLVTLRRLDHM